MSDYTATDKGEVRPEPAGDAGHSVRSTPLGGLAVTAALTPALAACGGGGGSGGGGGGTTPPPVTYYTTEAEAARFLHQAQFSASDADIESVRRLNYSAWLTQKFNAAQGQTGAAWLTAQGHGTPAADGNYFNPTMGDWMIWNQLFTRADQVRMRMAFALSEFFVVSLNPIDGFWPPYVIAGYWDVLNTHAFGNFRTLLEEITLNPAMGFYLNTRGNVKEDPATGQQPDENYAREIMQLFTIGLYELNSDGTLRHDLSGNPIETYGQSDITNLARVFTGYDWNYSRVTWQNTPFLPYGIPTTEFTSDRMSFDASKHSTLEVNVLGTRIPAGTSGAEAMRLALDALFNHANTGPFFAKQMIQRLVTSNPSPAYVGRVAAAFANNGSGVRGDLKAVWRTILTDAEARTVSSSPTSGKLREPIVRFVQWGRTFNFSSSSGKWQMYDLSNADWGLGQSPLRSLSVFNFFRPGYVPPHTAIGDAGLTAPEFQIHNETSTAGYINFMHSMIEGGYGDIQGNFSVLTAMAANSTQLVDWLNLHLTGNQLSAATVTAMKTALDATPVSSTSSESDKLNRVRGAMLMVMACPEYIVQK